MTKMLILHHYLQHDHHQDQNLVEKVGIVRFLLVDTAGAGFFVGGLS